MYTYQASARFKWGLGWLDSFIYKGVGGPKKGMNYEDTEKRDAVRLDRPKGQNWQLSLNNDQLITKNISNLSATGLAFKAPMWSSFPVGSVLKLELSLGPDLSYDCEGQIVWQKAGPANPGSMQQYGVHFTKIPSQMDSSVVQAINDHLLSQRRLEIEEGSVPSIIEQAKDIANSSSLISPILKVLAVIIPILALIFVLFFQSKGSADSLAERLGKSFEKRFILENMDKK